MLLKKINRVIKILIYFEYRRGIYFPVDTITTILSKILYLTINLMFWYFLIDSEYMIKGWTYSNIIVFIAFSELFYGMDGSIFSVSSRFWRIIHTGQLDCLLVRPLDPRLRFILVNIDYISLVSTLVEFTVLLLLSGLHIDFWSVLLGILIVILANLVLLNIRFLLSYMCFWHGRMDAITEISDSFNIFNKYPLTIMPKGLKILFQFFLPFYFFSTLSAELVVGFLAPLELFTVLIGLVLNFVLWVFVSDYIWKKGLEKYESIHG